MALFGTLNVAGPANRQGTIQQLAQNAAQAVLRRQRLRNLLAQAAGTGASGGGTHGPGVPLNSTMHGHAMGVRGATQRPNLSPDDLAEMARSAGRSGHLPRGIGGGVFGMGGGGFDFGALPAPADHSQSQASVGASPFHANPTQPVNPPNSGGGNGGGNGGGVGGNVPPGGFNSGPSAGANINAGPANIPGNDPSNIQLPQGTHGWIPLGGGLFYDPVNDIVRGQQSLNPIDTKF